tara:strand:+ start:63 stop:239 length:177 start_codon:yes stop_codon:yes gene_type:complete
VVEELRETKTHPLVVQMAQIQFFQQSHLLVEVSDILIKQLTVLLVVLEVVVATLIHHL